MENNYTKMKCVCVHMCMCMCVYVYACMCVCMKWIDCSIYSLGACVTNEHSIVTIQPVVLVFTGRKFADQKTT